MRGDPHAGSNLIGERSVQHAHALLGREERACLVRVEANDHDELVEDAQRSFDDLEVGHRRRVEHPGVHRETRSAVYAGGCSRVRHGAISECASPLTLLLLQFSLLGSKPQPIPPAALDLYATMSSSTALPGGGAA